MINKLGFLGNVQGNAKVNQPIKKINFSIAFPPDIVKGDAVTAEPSDIIKSESSRVEYLVLEANQQNGEKKLNVLCIGNPERKETSSVINHNELSQYSKCGKLDIQI